jgi:DNA-binding transcriptional regulator GbsR (MarR family)
MDSIPTKYLNQLKTISALKVLVAFLAMSSKVGNNEFEYSLTELEKDTGLSINAIKKGINELVELEFASRENRRGTQKTKYKITTVSQVNIVEANIVQSNIAESDTQEYLKATGARKKKEQQESDIINNINNIDFNNINFYTEDINNINSVINTNLLMTSTELGKLARRVLLEVYEPRVNRVINDKQKWYGMQMKFMKTMLTEYRTEQVVAAIKYWTEIEEAPNGLMNILFLKARNGRKKQPNIMIALDYYKAKYIKHYAHEKAAAEAETKRLEQLRKEQEEKQQQEEERKRVENMTSQEFVDGYMNRFSHITSKLKKEGANNAIKEQGEKTN